jgi:hypothetical protein
MGKATMLALAGLGIAVVLVCSYFLIDHLTFKKPVAWGVNFSQMQAEALGLDWKETYLAILDDLGVKNLKLMTQWDFIEGKQGVYFFDDIDWQVQQAQARNVNMIFVVGMKTGRWPECHQPLWVDDLTKADQQKEVLEYISKSS